MQPTLLEHSMAHSGWAHVLSWTLLHSTWIGACTALVLAAALRLLPASRCRWRYALSVAALALIPLFALGTLARECFASPSWAWGTAEAAREGPSPLQLAFDALRHGVDLWRIELALRLAPWERWIALAWLACLVVALVRLAGGWGWLRWERRSSQRRAAPIDQVRLARLGRGLGLRQRVPLYWSARCEVPMVVGARAPRIVIPQRLRPALQRGELDAVLLHELAHVHRGDPWLRLFEAVLQALFVLNPALHAIAARIEREREHCCDERALRQGVDRLGYVRALAALEQARRPRHARSGSWRVLRLLSSHALRATDGALLERIRRMTTGREPCCRFRFVAACAALVLGLAGLALGAVHARAPSPLFVALRSSSSAEIDLVVGSEHAQFVGAAELRGLPGAWKERVIVVAHPDAQRPAAGARATRLRIEAARPAVRVRGAKLSAHALAGEQLELRVFDAVR